MTSMTTTNSILKLQFDNGEFLRIVLKGPVTFETVVQAVSLAAPDLVPLRADALKYLDDEGDLCVLTPQTFTDFLEVMMQVHQSHDKTLKLRIRALGARVQSAQETNNFRSGKGASQGKGEACMPDNLKFFFQMLRVLGGPGTVFSDAIAKFFLQWLPVLAWKVEQKAETIERLVQRGLSEAWLQGLESLRNVSASTEGLEHFAETLVAGPGLGSSLVEMLVVLQTLTSAMQVKFVQSLVMKVQPLLENLVSPWCNGGIEAEGTGKIGCKSKGKGKWKGKQWHFANRENHPNANAKHFCPGVSAPTTAEQGNEGNNCNEDADSVAVPTHWGVTCDGCGAFPIQGPRFKCQSCADYDLCERCYAQKDVLHG